MMEDVVIYKGVKFGPTSMILVGVHGNERCGVDAIDGILEDFSIEKGTVLIGYGNPRAIEQNVRFTESNLNRMFKSDELLNDGEKKSYEYQRAQYLKSFFDQSDVLLDIHASSNPQSRRFVICEDIARDIVSALPVPLVVSGFDEVEPGGTDYYMNRIGKIGICVECGYLSDPSSIEVATESILAFLRVRGHVEGNIQKQDQSRIHMNQIYITKTDTFVLRKDFADFEEVKEGDSIGHDGEEIIRAESDSIILFAKSRNKIGEEGFLLGSYM